ncbi:peptide/nickel transport system substrate-binding protein [Sinosporangium album]|uniref:Peptide/nickel transport system substrate-binding protein n=1 Tax=Sinosporangium album TaxID=504805 RepID=A0A1G7TJS0_9ACTN|nr:ABC transporter substrate-binding protein [Sinosporangium album]SDG34760.1 peptide/nickel transport system substrate-binding protein [Sinosporangium album]
MRRSARIIALAVAAVTALALTACSNGTAREAEPVGTTSAQSAKESTFVYVTNLSVVTSWDPAISYSNEIIAMQNIYEGLTIYNPVTKKASPRLATGWTSTPDNKTWTFTLRNGATFHTGRPVDSAAVKASIERTRKLAQGAAYIWDPVDSIGTPDPTTVIFNLKYPVPLDLVAASSYAAYIYDTEAAGDEDLGEWFEKGHDAGSGPYTIARWQKGKRSEVRLTAYEGYWGGWEGPHYKNVEFWAVNEMKAAWQLLQRGEATYVSRMSPQLYRKASTAGGIRTMEVPSFQTMLMLFNTASGPLQDVRLRKAVQKALDYDGVVAALKGAGSQTSGIVPTGMLGHARDMVPRQDLAAAEALLREAGYGPGGRELRLTLTYAAGDDDQRVLVSRLNSVLAALNVTVDARAMQWEAQWDLGKSKDPRKRQDIFVMYWWPDTPDAYSWFVNIFRHTDPISFNFTYMKNTDLDARIEKLPGLTATNRRAAEEAYEELQRELIDERAVVAVPWVVNYQRAYLGGVQNYTDNPAYGNVVFVHDLTPTG